MELPGIKVIQSVPGQLSLEISKLRDDQQVAQEMQQRFTAINGINQVEVDHATGTVVVSYDRAALGSLTSLLALKETFSLFFPEISLGQLTTFFSQSI